LWAADNLPLALRRSPVALSVHLLGRPSVDVDGERVAARGRKVWALLAYLASTEAEVGREQLAALLFADADDPLGALRWNLAELRRLLRSPSILKGDRLTLSLPPGSVVDVRLLSAGTWAEAIEVPGLGRDLLEGMDFPSSPAFEAWLLNERRHLKGGSEAVLREAALSQLAIGNGESAIDLATRLVALDPLREDYQALLIRTYATAGDNEGAGRQLAACIELFRKELGVEPGIAVSSAAQVAPGSATVAPAMGSAAARAQLDAGKAAIDAGALEAGLECLRRATAEAHACGDLSLKANALFAMGSALVHSGRRAMQDEGAAALHETIAICERTGDGLLAAAAHRELAWPEVLSGRYGRAEIILRRARELSQGDEQEEAAVLSVLGMCLTDVARYGESIDHLRHSLELSRSAGDDKRTAFALAFLGRAHTLRHEFEPAMSELKESLELVEGTAWIGFRALPESMLGELRLLQGDLEPASEILEHAFALGLRLGDACYECAAATGLGRLEYVRGRPQAAIERLEDARMRLVLRPDYLFLEAQALESLSSVAVEDGHPSATKWINDLESIAGRTGMRELLARSYLHRSRAGDPSALEVARVVAADIDNPALDALLKDEPALAPPQPIPLGN
jgi:DNA-binding SARP family transcriptional activator